MTTKEGDLLGELIAICERIVDAARSPREMSGMREISADEVEALEDVLSKATKDEDEDICGFCGEPGADKMPHPVRWPGEESAGTELVHIECEREECRRAHAALTDRQGEDFLRSILDGTENHEANARLIAAAPELLAVCVAIVAAWKSIPMYHQASSSMKDDEMWEAAQSAIAKATGIS